MLRRAVARRWCSRLPRAAGRHPDAAAADLLALILGDSPSGRLHAAHREAAPAPSGESFRAGRPRCCCSARNCRRAPIRSRSARGHAGDHRVLRREPVSEAELQRARAKVAEELGADLQQPGKAVGMVLSGGGGAGRLAPVLPSARDRVRDASWPTCSAWPCSASSPTTAPRRPTCPPTSRSARAGAAAHRHGTGDEGLPAAAASRAEAFAATPANIDARARSASEVGGLKAAWWPRPRAARRRAVLTLRFGDEKSLAGLGEVADFTAALLDKGSAR